MDGVIISHLLYADDVVLLAEKEEDLQKMLHALYEWCSEWGLVVNTSKSAVVHFRPPSHAATKYVFLCGDKPIYQESMYKYLGLLLTEHLDYKVTVKMVAQSAHRALGLLIAKVKRLGGVPYQCFVKLYESLVWSTIAYSASIWGSRSYPDIEAVHNRACRFYLGLGQHAPIAALRGDTGMIPPLCRQVREMTRQFVRLKSMHPTRLNHRILRWSENQRGVRCRAWCGRLEKLLSDLNVPENIKNVYNTAFTEHVAKACMDKYITTWQADIARIAAKHGPGGNKLRIYRCFKDEFCVEPYVLKVRSFAARSSMAKFRAGVAPINIELGRFLGIPAMDRMCNLCDDKVEDELHVIIDCPMYTGLRKELFTQSQYLLEQFDTLTDIDKMRYLFTNNAICNKTAKTCRLILETRQRAISILIT